MIKLNKYLVEKGYIKEDENKEDKVEELDVN